MNLKFRILKYANNIDPNTFDCDAAASPIALNTLSLLIEVDGDEVLNLGAGSITTGTTASIVTGGGVNVDFSIEDTDYFVLNIDNAMGDTNEVRLRFFDESSFVYDQTFTVYGYDIGKNPNDVFPAGFENELDELDFYLVPKFFLFPGIIYNNTVCTKIFNYREYGNEDTLHVLKTSSGYYDSLALRVPSNPIGNGNLLSTAPYVAIPGPKTPSGVDLTSLDVGTTGGGITTYENWPIKPPSKATPLVTYNFGNVSCASCECGENGMTVDFVMEGTILDQYLRNLIAQYHNLTTVFFVANLKDMADNGNIIDTDNTSVVANPDIPWVSFPWTYTPGVTIPFDSYYQLDLEIRLLAVDGELVYTESIDLLPCVYSEFARTGCGTIQFSSKGANDRILRVYSVDSDGTETLYSEDTGVDTNDAIILTLPDGVYFIKLYESDGTTLQYVYKHVSICTIQNCLVSYAKLLACQDPCAEVQESDCGCGSNGLTTPESLATFHLLVFNLFNLMNSVYQTSYIVETLTEADTVVFSEMATLIERLSNYCEGC